MFKLEQGGQLIPLRGAVAADLVHVTGPAFANGEQMGSLLPAEHLVDVLMQMGAEAVAGGEFLGNLVDDIDAEAIYTQVYPEVHHSAHLLPDSGVVPVQISLLDGIGVQIILASFGAVFPGRTAEAGFPIGQRLVCPVVEIAVGIILALLGLQEPLVLGGGVVGDQVHDDLDAMLMGLLDEDLHIIQGAELVHNIPVVGDIITVVHIGALVAGAEPNGVDAQFLQIGQLLADALQVADTVMVGVHEAPGIDLINDQLGKIHILFSQHFVHTSYVFLCF